MFRSLSGDQNCIIQHLVPSHSVGGCAVLSQPVHCTATYRVWWYQMLCNTVLTPWWWAQKYM